jgi:hypothetical protein
MPGKLILSRLPIDRPTCIALQRTGQIVPSRFHAGGRVRFRLVDGRDLYTDLALSQRITDLRVRPMEPFYVCARKQGRARRIELWLSGERSVAA